MSIAGPSADNEEDARSLQRVWSPPRGWRYWSEVNNDVVGLWYLCTALGFFLFAGVLGLLMRVQLALPGNELLDASRYAQVFTLHGSVMMFLFAVPLFEAAAVLLLPQILGTRDLPFPRLSAYGYWCFLIGGVFVCGSILFGAAPEGGWFMYPPMTTRFQPGIGADVWLLGLSFIEISSIAAAIELIVGILRCRPPGMSIQLMPLYAWYILVVAVMIVLAFPPLIAGDLLFELERAFDWPFFDAARGGDALLWQHLFWIFGHPEVYIIFLPAMALVASLLPAMARAPIAGYSWVVLAAVGTGFLSFGLWVHHMYTTGLPDLSLGFFSAASVAVAIPTAVQLACFIGTLLTGRVERIGVPMLYLAGALAIFVIGGLSGVMVAIAPFDFQAHDSYFVVAHLHYVLIGGMLFPALAAVHYYFPLVRARLLSERLGRIAFWILFGGFNLAFLPMHVSGLAGMPRRVHTYAADAGLSTLNLVSTIGAFVFAAGLLLLAFDLLRPRRGQPFAPRNPWNAPSLEWLPTLPKPSFAPRSIPQVEGRYPLWERPALVAEVEAGLHFLPHAHEGFRETLVGDALSAEPQQCLRVPGPGFVPMIAAVFTGAAFILATFQWWITAGAAAAAATLVIAYWLWLRPGQDRATTHKAVGRGLVLPLYASGPRSVGWWAMFILLVADGAAFLSLLFAYGYYWTLHPDLPIEPARAACQAAAPLVLAVAAAWLATYAAQRLLRRARVRLMAGIPLIVALAATLVSVPLLPRALAAAAIDPTVHVHHAMVWALALWCATHLAFGALLLGWCLLRLAARRLDAVHDADLRNTLLAWPFLASTTGISLLAFALFAQRGGGT